MSRRMRQIAVWIWGAAALAAAPAAHAQTASGSRVALSVEQMQQAAELNLSRGHADRALVLTDALLQRDPHDVPALLIRAHALRMLGQYAPAQEAARAGWQHGKTDNHKYAAALLMAQALSADGKRTRAQLWLRRAAQVAPDAANAARVAQDFRYLRQRNPWQTHLSFTLAPNSNINNGSARESSALLYEIFGPLFGGSEVQLGASSQALSGIEAGVQLQTRYRFSQTEHRAHDLRMGLSYRSYTLSRSAKADLAEEDAARVARGEAARGIGGGDFAYGTVQLGYGFKQLRKDRRGEFTATADIGQSFYSGARYASYLDLSLGQSYYISPVTKLNFGLGSEISRAQRGSDQEQITAHAGLSRKLSNGDGLYLGVALGTVQADRAQLEYGEIRLRAGYVLGRQIMGTALQFGLSSSFRDYDVSPHDPSGRREVKLAAEVTATFKQIDYYGFNPTVSVSASTTNSNIGLYDVNRLGLSIGVASSF